MPLAISRLTSRLSGRWAVGATFVAAAGFALLVRPSGGIGLALLFLLFVPLEKLLSLRPQKVLRRGLFTDLTHLLVNNTLVAGATIALVTIAVLPVFWIRSFDVQGALPEAVAIALAFVIAFFGNYLGHRLTHRVPFLWKFHAVHHSIEEMDWVASGRLHPLDSAFTQACAIVPLFLLGYGGEVFAGVGVVVAFLALFQHANVRLRFPGLRWVVNTPEWHHWHHASDPEARDTNFGLPVIDKLFGTAYLPRDRRPTGFGIPDPVPEGSWFGHLAYPFTGPSTRPSPGPAARNARLSQPAPILEACATSTAS